MSVIKTHHTRISQKKNHNSSCGVIRNCRNSNKAAARITQMSNNLGTKGQSIFLFLFARTMHSWSLWHLQSVKFLQNKPISKQADPMQTKRRSPVENCAINSIRRVRVPVSRAISQGGVAKSNRQSKHGNPDTLKQSSVTETVK